MIVSEAKAALARKLNIDYSNIALNDLFSEADLSDYLEQGAMKAWDYRSWDFAEDSQTGTLTSEQITNGYVAHPPKLVPSSIFLLKIAGKEYDKKNFQDFQKYFEDYPSGTDRIWCEYKRLVFFNSNVASAGDTIDTWGKLNFQAFASDAALMPFSPSSDTEQYSGNQAIVQLAYAEALASDKKKNPNGAEAERKVAFSTLDILWNAFVNGRSIEQSKNRPMFDAPDFFRANNGQSNQIGTFNNG